MGGDRARSRKRYRYAMVRGDRTYIVCGARTRPAIVRTPWISGAAFALVLLVAALALGHPVRDSGDRASAPFLPSTRYSASDFFTTAR